MAGIKGNRKIWAAAFSLCRIYSGIQPPAKVVLTFQPAGARR